MADIQVPEAQQMNGDRPSGAASEIGSKRQRRPSVRLGDLGGDPPYDRRPTKHQWKQSHFSLSTKPSKSRNLLSFTSPSAEHDETLAPDDKVENLESVAIGSWKAKDSKKRGSTATKRVRTNWVSKVTDEGGGGAEPDTDKYSGGEDLDDDYHHGYDVDNSDSPLKEQSPIHSSENNGRMYRRPTRLIRRTDHHDGVDFSGPSDTDMRDRSARWREDGVRVWLNGLGLGRYAPVFEIHEVDDEVLPMLTLEDLKDMGINAVGSRRKMYSAIQKLGKGFS